MKIYSLLSSFFTKPDLGLLILRVGLGGFMVAHGWPKITGGPERWEGLGSAIQHVGLPIEALYIPFGLAGALAEFLGGILLIVGLFTRTAAFFLLCTMLVAAALVNTRGEAFLMTTARPLELAVVFLALMFIGSGRFAIRPRGRS